MHFINAPMLCEHNHVIHANGILRHVLDFHTMPPAHTQRGILVTTHMYSQYLL